MSWCFADEVDAYSESVLDLLKLDDYEALVPSLWPLEVVNVLLVAERKQRISEARSRRFLELLANLPITVDDFSPFVSPPEILALGRHHRLSAYDASYFELAMRKGLPLATLDKRLHRVATGQDPSLLLTPDNPRG